jgi:RNase P/RNase MRP subunit p29
MFDPHLKAGSKVRVLDHGILSANERELIGKAGRIVRAYVSSCRLEIEGKSVQLPKVALELVGKR